MGAGASSLHNNRKGAGELMCPPGKIEVRRKKLLYRNENILVISVETFIRRIYTSLPIQDSLSCFLHCEQAADAFGRYLDKKGMLQLLKLYMSFHLRNLDCPRVALEWYLLLCPNSALTLDEDDDLLLQAQAIACKEISSLLSKTVFPSFLDSGEYKKWRAHERSKYSAIFLRVSVAHDDEHTSLLPRQEPSVANSVIEEDTQKFLQCMHSSDMSLLATGDRWLYTLLASSVNLPIGVTLLLAGEESRIVYVNNAYAASRGVRSIELLGRSWTRLLSANLPSKIARDISFAVGVGACYTCLNESCGARNCFSAVELYQPLYDKSGTHVYVLVLHLPIADDSLHNRCICEHALQELVVVLPHTIEGSHKRTLR